MFSAFTPIGEFLGIADTHLESNGSPMTADCGSAAFSP
jgi:hypothetical protein